MLFGKKKKNKPIPKDNTQNQFYEAIYRWLNNGTILNKDDLKSYVKLGFEGNPDVYSIINNIDLKFSQVPFKLVGINAKGDEIEYKSHELIDRLKNPNSYQTWFEFSYLWETFRLVTGNSIVYAPLLENGNNKGKLTNLGLLLTPSQNVEIVSDGMFNPIGGYILDIDSQRLKIDPQNIIHTRIPGLTYQNGKNFMGQSPLKAAVNLIYTQNKGYELLGNLYNNPMPPGMLVDESQTTPYSLEVQSKLESAWEKKYSKGNNKGAPILTGGKKQWISFMTSTISDLMVVDNLQNGARVLANVLNWPSALMNDTSAMTLDNLKVFIKQAYTDRIKPDLSAMFEDFNNSFVQAYAKEGEKLELRADFSQIEELQADKKITAEWINILVNNGIINREEARAIMEFEATDKEGMQRMTMPFNLVDVDDYTPSDADTNKNLKPNEPYE